MVGGDSIAGTADIPVLRSRWKSRDHVGEAKPEVRVYYRRVRFIRRFRYDLPTFCVIPDTGAPNKVYAGSLEVFSTFQQLPNVKVVEVDQEFAQNGLTTAKITIDNLHLAAKTGVGGLFHAIERGWFSPTRGFKPPNRPATAPTKNEWFDLMRKKSTQIMVVAGYGDARVPIFTGLISDTDLRSRPDQMDITCRCFGQILTDQRAFAWAKHPQVLDPITFADRLQSHDVEHVGDGALASNTSQGHLPRFVTDDSDDTYWLGKKHDTPGAQEWVSIHVPGGHYASFRLQPLFEGMSAYVSVYRRNAQVWIDEGKGYTAEGIPWVKFIPTVKMGQHGYDLGNEYQLGDDSVFRITFTNLHRHNAGNGEGYYAGAREFKAAKRDKSADSKKQHWILVDDAADVVKVVLQWCGLHEWEVESTGVRLKDKLIFNRQTSFMDIINKIAELTNYIFTLKPPENFNEDNLSSQTNLSIGIPVFRSNQAMPSTPLDRVESVRDDDLLTGIEAKFSDEPLPQHVRARGKPLAKKKGGKALGGDRTPRVMAGYQPPWSRSDSLHNAAIKKVAVHYDNMLETPQDCILACIFICFRAALESAKAQIQVPAYPLIHLDHQTSIFDRGTGVSTRLWVTQRHLEISTGDDASFVMTLGGSLIDTPEIVAMRSELSSALAQAGLNPYPLAQPTLGDIGG